MDFIGVISRNFFGFMMGMVMSCVFTMLESFKHGKFSLRIIFPSLSVQFVVISLMFLLQKVFQGIYQTNEKTEFLAFINLIQR